MLTRFFIVALLSVVSTFAVADRYRQFTYEVTITNITRGQTFTPQLVVTHNRNVQLFELGQPSSSELEILAEDGNTQPLTDLLGSLGRKVGDVQTIAGLLEPGESISTTVKANPYRHPVISVAAMLIPTNDTFMALDSLRLPYRGTKTRLLKAYDAGTELNDQNCANIPGPRCGGAGFSEGPNEGDEGYVYIGNGFHDLGNADDLGNEILGPLVYDWRNPVAKVTVQRVY
ncbi:MAG: spondin domain-containing protein [Cellvibrionaceae bacterium]